MQVEILTSEEERLVYQILTNLNINLTGFIEPKQVIAAVKNRVALDQNGALLNELVYREIGNEIYKACQDESVKDEAFQWLGGYLYRHLYPKTDKYLAEDLTNLSLLNIYRNLGKCHTPDYFLKWALQIAYREFLQNRRKRTIETGVENLSDFLDVSSPEPEKMAVSRETLEFILKHIYQLKAGKRTTTYQHILIGTYFLDQSDIEIESILKLTPIQVQKLRYQALLILRRDKKFIENLR